MALIGKPAPDFTADAVFAGNKMDKLTLSNNWKNGKYTVLWFYPFDFTFVCPTELVAFNAALAEFKKRNTEVVAVSIDSKFVHKAWRDTPEADGGVGDLQYPMVADVKKEIARAYDVLAHDVGAAYRGLFLIDAKGVVRHMVINDLDLGRSVDEALRMVDALQYTEKHGEVCPANWKPGQDAINKAKAKEYFSKHAPKAAVRVKA